MEKLHNQSKLVSIHGSTVVIEKLLGEGNQGLVYQVSYDGKSKALKIYNPNAFNDPKAFYTILKSKVELGSPNDSFLWPRDIVIIDQPTFGCITDLLPKGYKNLSAFLTRSVKFDSFRTIVDAAIGIVSALRILHSKGYSYQDLNDDSFLIEPQSGKVLIADCDSIGIAPNHTHTGIIGKPRYMAPEIVRGEALPSIATDRYSLAVILFLMITNCHPLEGTRSLVPCITPELERVLYGTDPVFICDPIDRRNAPNPFIHKNIEKIWPELPKYLRDAFIRSFTIGLKDPNQRLTEKEWEALLIHFRSDIIPCSCGNENFTWDIHNPRCGSCDRLLGPFKVLKLTGCNYLLPVLSGNVVFRQQLGISDVDKGKEAILRIITNPEDKNLYLQNISGEDMECVTPTGRQVMVPNKSVVPSNPGLALMLNDGAAIVLEPERQEQQNNEALMELEREKTDMPNQDEIISIPRKELHVYFVLDTSGSMTGPRINALNDALRDTISKLYEINKSNADYVIKIGILEFNTWVNWVTVNSNNEPAVHDLADFYLPDLEAGGVTALGAALNELNDKLSRNKLQYSNTGNKTPVIIFTSDGAPCDEWQRALGQLNENRWYVIAKKIAFAIGDAADMNVLAQVVGSSTHVISINDLAEFQDVFQITTINSIVAPELDNPAEEWPPNSDSEIYDGVIGSTEGLFNSGEW